MAPVKHCAGNRTGPKTSMVCGQVGRSDNINTGTPSPNRTCRHKFLSGVRSTWMFLKKRKLTPNLTNVGGKSQRPKAK